MPKTLLLADDSVTIQKVVGITFANEDVELVTVDNGDDALVRARQIKPDLVLADIGMPGLDGYALCEAIRQDPDLANTPVLLLTGTFETYDEDRAHEVGASGHISKPFEAQALVDRVLTMIAQSEAAAASRPSPPTQPILAPASPPMTSAPEMAARPRPELPPLPGASVSNAARPSKPRATSTFDFDVTPDPSVEVPAVAEPLWEPGPDFEAHDDSPARRVHASLEPSEEAPSPDATHLFSPEAVRAPARPPAAVEPLHAAAPARSDFSFEDLDFEEPTAPPGSHTEIFGENSGPLAAETVVAIRETPRLDAPAPITAPALPDLLRDDEITAPSQDLSALDFSDAEPEIEAEPLDEDDPFGEPFSPDTSAALAEPEFAPVRTRGAESTPAPEATRLLAQADALDANEDGLELDGDLLDVEPIPELPMSEPPEELDAWSDVHEPVEPDPRPTAPLNTASRPTDSGRTTAPIIDSTLLSQTLEKVAWEAFGSLSEQVVNEVRKRVEAVVWEVVPQMCERLIREEIARLKAELPE